MKAYVWCVILCSLAMFFGCSTVDVTTDFDKGVDFTRFKSFDWMKPVVEHDSGSPSLMNSQLAHKRIKEAIQRELSGKGLRFVRESPDLLVSFHSGVKDKIDVERYGYRYGHWGQFWGVNEDVIRYKEGAIVVDLIDAKSKDLLWRGIAEDVVDKSDTPDDVVSKFVRALFKEYPPKA